MTRRPLLLVMLVVSLVGGAARSASAADSVRVVAAQAAVRLNADPDSQTITTVKAGTVLELNATRGEWFQVWVPATQPNGARRLGFLARSDAELMPDSQPRAPAATTPLSPSSSVPDSARSSHPRGDVDIFFGSTFNLPGPRAFVSVGVTTADSGQRMHLPTLGYAVGGWFGERRIFGVYGDFSGIFGGSAFAQVGATRSEVSSGVVDFHGGFQVQAPGRVRPYGVIGVGATFVHDVGTLTFNGVERQSFDETTTLLSVVLGGGVRFMLGNRWGLKVGVDLVAAAQAGDEEVTLDYQRLTGGVVYSFR